MSGSGRTASIRPGHERGAPKGATSSAERSVVMWVGQAPSAFARVLVAALTPFSAVDAMSNSAL